MKILETNASYHANPAIGSTLLKKIHSETLLHALTSPFIETQSTKLGSALHCAILEPERFEADFLVAPKCDRRTKEGKTIWESFQALAQGKTVIDEEDMETIKGMKDSVLSHPTASAMLTGGEAEYAYYSTDPDTGIQKKCRPDYHKGGALIDLKSTSDASFEGFARQVGQLGYHLQGAYYTDVFNESQGTNYKDFFFIAVENKFPYAVAVYRLDSTHMDHGRLAYKKAICRYADFKNSGASIEDLQTLRNYGYPTDILDIQVPYYILDKIQIA